MGYTFGAGTSNKIVCGTDVVTKASTWSLFVRLKVLSANTTTRRICEYGQTSGGFRAQFYSHFLVGTNDLRVGHSIGGGFNEVGWVTGWSAGSIHSFVGVNNGTGIIIYADTDSTAKATNALAGGNSDQDSGQVFTIGNLDTFSDGADCDIYEVAWFPSTVLTGAQAAQLGAGSPVGVPLPRHSWGLINNPKAEFGGVHGTVTGASVVAHGVTNVYPVPITGRVLLGVG